MFSASRLHCLWKPNCGVDDKLVGADHLRACLLSSCVFCMDAKRMAEHPYFSPQRKR